MSSGAAVNVPTNYKIKEQDINQKLQLYGIYSAFANGKVPSNQQIDVALNSALASKSLASPSKKLSAEGQKLVQDFREVIEQAKFLLLTKNQGNLLQDFIWQTQQISGGNASLPGAPVDKDTAKQHGNQALDGLRTLGTLLISNGQFRKLLSDATVLIRDIAGDAAGKAATKVKPGEHELNQIDEPAEDNTWHDVPDLSRDNIKNQASSKWNEQKPFGKGEAKNALGDASQAAHPSGSRDPADAADLAARDQQQGTNSGVDAASGAGAAARTLKDNAKQNVPGDTQEKGREYRDRTTNYLKDKLPQERREQTIWRLKKMVAEVQGHQDYQQAIETLLSLAEEYTGHGSNLAQQGQGTVKGAHDDSALTTAETDIKTLIERFANSTSLDDLFDSINTIYADANRDPELKNWFKDMDKFIRKCLQEQGYILQDSSTEQWNKLYDHGNFLLRDRYRNHTDRIVDELKFYADQFDKDAQNKQFGNAVNKLFLDLGNDENGKATFKPHLVKDLTDVILPGFFESIRYVPIPRIEYKDNMIDAVVENLVLEGDNLAPNVMEFGSDNYWRWGRKQISNKNKNKVMLSVSGIQCDLRDVSYYVKKKEGFPSVTDKGVMDVILGGSGLSFKVAMETADKTDQNYFFKVNSVHVEIKNMNIILKQSNHKLLFKVFKPLLLKVMTPVIQKVVEKQVKDNIHQLDGILYQIHQEAQRAQRDLANNPEQAQNIYQRYANAANKKIMQGKEKKNQAQAKAGQTNIAMTQHDSIFPNIKLPGGISTKATEYKELAEKGDKWQSPIFGIGSAKESTNIPKLSQVSRKSHNVNSEGVRGPNNLEGGSGTGYDSASTGAYGNTAGYDNSSSGYGTQTGSSGYGNQGTSGYGNQGTSGYANTGSSGYGNQGTSGYGNTTGTSGYGNTGGVASGLTGASATNTTGGEFTNQVDRAFETSDSYKSPNGASGTTGTTGTSTGGTTLGANNPVLTGRQ